VGVNHAEFVNLLFTLPLIPSPQGRGDGLFTKPSTTRRWTQCVRLAAYDIDLRGNLLNWWQERLK